MPLTYYFNIAVEDDDVMRCEKEFSITINNAVFECEIVTTTLPDSECGVAYNAAIDATASGPHTFAIVDGALPPGLTLNENTGVISGTPTCPPLILDESGNPWLDENDNPILVE